MEKISEIKKFIKKKKSQGFEGYTDMLEYFENFSSEQLDYIEISFKMGVESSKRLLAYREIATLFVAILALLAACNPELPKVNLGFLTLLCAFMLFAILVFCYLSVKPSGDIDLSGTALEVIAKVKNNRQVGQSEQRNGNENLTE